MAQITLVNMNMLYMRSIDTVEREFHVPLGPLYLTSALERQGHEVDFRDYQLYDGEDPFSVESILTFFKNPFPILGVSCMANLLPFTILALKHFKAHYPETRVVMGGVGPTAVEREILENFPWIDVIVRGEAEISAPMLMTALENNRDLNSVPGISFRFQGSVISTPSPPRISDLDSLSFPAYHHIDMRSYRGYGLITSRGCPFPCTFCSVAPIWGRRPAMRSIHNIIQEMTYLYNEFGVDMFLFQDEYFISTEDRAKEFCKALRKARLPVKWKCFGRVNLTSRRMMEEMSRNGCIELRFGIESGSERILQRTQKGFTSAQAIETVSQAVRLFPGIDAFYIWGFPYETMEDFEQTLFQMITFRMIGARVLPSLLCLLPQTQIYKDYVDPDKLDFCRELFPEYMITGHEIRHSARISIARCHEEIFELIKAHPAIFPGFFHLDLENNILPKLEKLEKYGFYTHQPESRSTGESCGAHSPRIATSPLAVS